MGTWQNLKVRGWLPCLLGGVSTGAWYKAQPRQAKRPSIWWARCTQLTDCQAPEPGGPCLARTLSRGLSARVKHPAERGMCGGRLRIRRSPSGGPPPSWGTECGGGSLQEVSGAPQESPVSKSRPWSIFPQSPSGETWPFFVILSARPPWRSQRRRGRKERGGGGGGGRESWSTAFPAGLS